jgi:drug/metabolite transporter (DMT)-like permease
MTHRDVGRSRELDCQKKRGPDDARARHRGGGTVGSIMSSDEGGGRGDHSLAVAPVKSAAGVVDFRAYVYVVLMVVLGSTTAAAAKFAVRDLPVALVPVLRFGLAGLCLLPVVWGRGVLTRLVREDPWLLLLSAALCVPINQGFFLSAALLGPTSHVGLFYATCPLVVLLLAWAMKLERLDLGRLWGVLASVAGIVVIGVGNFWNGGAGTAVEVRAVVLADCLLVGAVLSWGAYMAVSKPLVQRHGAMPALAGTVLLGCLLSIPVALLVGPAWPPFGQVSTTAWLALAVLSLFITPFGWAFQNLALSRFEASQVATFSNGSPMLTIVWGIWLFDEVLTLALILGGALTLGGMYWASRPRQRASAVGVSRPRQCDLNERAPGERLAVVAVLALAEESAGR